MIAFSKPTLKRKDMDGVLTAMVNDSIGPGKNCESFCSDFTSFTSSNYSQAFRCYPDAIKAVFLKFGAKKGTKIAISLLTPVVYLNVANELGCEVIFTDVYKDNGCPDLKEIDCDILVLYEPPACLPVVYDEENEEYRAIEYLQNVKIIEDISLTVGSSCTDKFSAGIFGDAVICCLEDTFPVCAAGGAVVAFKGELISEVPDKLITLPDLNAALGAMQLANLEQNISKRSEIAAVYNNALEKTSNRLFGLKLLEFKPNYSSYSVVLDSKVKDVISFAEKYSVPVKQTFEFSVCASLDRVMYDRYPVSASYYYRTLSFPLYSFLLPEEINTIKKVLSHLP